MTPPSGSKPNYYICGGGSEMNCPDWDDINGCWRNCKEIGDDGCYVYDEVKEAHNDTRR